MISLSINFEDVKIFLTNAFLTGIPVGTLRILQSNFLVAGKVVLIFKIISKYYFFYKIGGGNRGVRKNEIIFPRLRKKRSS